MNWITLIGLAAATGTTGAFLPQAIKTMRTKSTKDISLGMYSIITLGVILWIIYGILIKDLPVFLANAIVFLFTFTILILKVRYK